MTTELQQLPLSAKQERLLRWIQDYRTKHSYSPSMDEVSDGLGIVPSSVYKTLKILERKGWVRRDKNTARSIVILPEGIS